MIKGSTINYFTSIVIGIFHFVYLLFSRKKFIYLSEYIPSEKKPGILSCWHENAFISLSLKVPRDISILVSQSKDGDLVRGITSVNGWSAVRGSSSKGGQEALQAYQKFLKENPTYSVGITVDGPRGPRRLAKRGAFEIAKLSGRPVVPFLPVAKNNKVLRTWDKMKIPRIFQTYYYIFGEPIFISPDHCDPKYQKEREILRERLNSLQDYFDLHY
jgi:lysophospholipid acyltransferase (LPLAT)-like uncharacterized protein